MTWEMALEMAGSWCATFLFVYLLGRLLRWSWIPRIVRNIVTIEDQYASFTLDWFWKHEACLVGKEWHWVIRGEIEEKVPWYLGKKLDVAVVSASPEWIAAKQLPFFSYHEPCISPQHPYHVLAFRLDRNFLRVMYHSGTDEWWNVDKRVRLSFPERVKAERALGDRRETSLFLDSPLAHQARKYFEEIQQRPNQFGRCVGKEISFDAGTAYLCRLDSGTDMHCLVILYKPTHESARYRDVFTGEVVKDDAVSRALQLQDLMDGPEFVVMEEHLCHFAPGPQINWVDHDDGCVSVRLKRGEDRWLHIVTVREMRYNYETGHFLTEVQEALVALRRVQSQHDQDVHRSRAGSLSLSSGPGVGALDLSPDTEGLGGALSEARPAQAQRSRGSQGQSS